MQDCFQLQLQLDSDSQMMSLECCHKPTILNISLLLFLDLFFYKFSPSGGNDGHLPVQTSLVFLTIAEECLFFSIISKCPKENCDYPCLVPHDQSLLPQIMQYLARSVSSVYFLRWWWWWWWWMQKCVPGGEGQGISPTRNGVPTRKAVRKCLLGRKRINYHNSLAILKLPVMSSILCLLLTRIILDPEYALLFKFFFFFFFCSKKGI